MRLLSNSQKKGSECKVIRVEHKIEIEIVHDSTNIHITISKDSVTITKSALGRFVDGNITLSWEEFDDIVDAISRYKGEVENVYS